MDYETFSAVCETYSLNYHHSNPHIFEIIVPEHSFEKFCRCLEADTGRTTVRKISKVFEGHVHVNVVSHRHRKRKFDRDPWRAEWKILPFGYRRLIGRHLDYAMYDEACHDVLCREVTRVLSLQDACIKTIADRLLFCLNRVECLGPPILPESLVEAIFRRGKALLKIPLSPLPSTSYSLSSLYQAFEKVDFVHSKQFVTWFQNRTGVPFDFSFVVVVVFRYVLESGMCKKLCSKCFKLESKTRWEPSLGRRFVKSIFINKNYIQNPLNWCNACKQVPLFQILTPSQFKEQYKKYDFLQQNDGYIMMNDKQ